MKVCLFDIDGTLITTGMAGKDAMIEAFLKVAELTELEHIFQVSGKTDRGIFAELYELHGQTLNEDAWHTFLDQYLGGLATNLPQRQGLVLEGVAALLAKLSQRDDVLLGLLTGNVEKGAALKLGHYGIHEYFAFGGFGDHHPNRDDVARAALEAAEVFHGETISPNDVYVIGDTPNDVKCARSIGAKAVAVATGVFSEEELEAAKPDLLLTNLADAEAVTRFIFG
ncbi:HAD family hydrolase [Bremerella alba]|uniref:phosphoglycolate phosphatase n=1 Tax=Bremerella alba TaxID=980252 RepID=A0A7V9A816_9BACT|nr:HAD family hydrolase [Bremerella alba]MBA2116000.1 Phosphoglycolate phosphatase [Bremerella alba]